MVEQFINLSIVLLKKSIKFIKTGHIPRVRDGEASGLASVNVQSSDSKLKQLI